MRPVNKRKSGRAVAGGESLRSEVVVTLLTEKRNPGSGAGWAQARQSYSKRAGAEVGKSWHAVAMEGSWS